MRFQNQGMLVLIWMLAAVLMFGCEGSRKASREDTPGPSGPAVSASPPTVLPAASLPAAGGGGGTAPPAGIAAASIGAGRIFDAAGYGSKPGISFAIGQDGSAWRWGWGFGTPEGDYRPKRVRADRPVVQMTRMYMLGADGHVLKLGATEKDPPHVVEGLADIVSIQQLDEMFGTLFALRKDGTVWYLARETGKPLRFGNFTGVTAICGTSFSLFVQEQGGRLWYAAGQNGDILKPENHSVLLEQGVTSVSAGYSDEALIKTGAGEYRLFLPREHRVVEEPRLSGAVAAAVAGEGTYLFVKQDGTVWGFGKNEDGLLGTRKESTVSDPVPVEGLKGITGLAAGNHHALALNGAGQVYTWGRNMDGQLGRIPVIWDRWQELGELAGVRKAVAAPERPYFVMEDGTLQTLKPDCTFEAVSGVSGIRSMAIVQGYPVTLDTAGGIRLWEKDFATSTPLNLSVPVKEMAAGGDRLLLLDSLGQLELVFLQTAADSGIPGADSTAGLVPAGTERVAAEGGWTSRIRSLYGNPYLFMALTEDGKVFYGDRTAEGGHLFRSVMGLGPVKELSADEYVMHTAEPARVWALERTGDLREIRMELKLEWKRAAGKPEVLSVRPQVQPAKAKDIAHVSGALMIGKDGTAREEGYKIALHASLPAPLRLVSSLYAYNIEGPGLHYHLLVDERGKVAILGYNPFGQSGFVPEPVQLSGT